MSNRESDSEGLSADVTHGQTIQVDGREFDIERVGRKSTDVWFELNIEVEESTKGTPNHEFRSIIDGVGRSALTDQLIERAVQGWSDSHPDYTVRGFGISEGRVARIGRPVDSPEVDNG